MKPDIRDESAGVTAHVVEVLPAALVMPAAPLATVKAAQDAYLELCDSLLSAEDYQTVAEKQFRKKSGWRKLAVAYNVSCQVLDEEFSYDDRGRIARAKYRIRATAPNGRFMDGVGLCAVWEKCCDPATCKLRTHWEDSGRPTGHVHCKPDCDGRHAFTKPDHDVPATAMTRATNRACSDLFGLGEVSAEEVDDHRGVDRGHHDAGRTQPRAPRAPAERVEHLKTLARALDYPGDETKRVIDATVRRSTAGWGDLSASEVEQTIGVFESLQPDDEGQTGYGGGEEPF